MIRWLAVFFAIVVAAGLGFLAGYIQWGQQAAQVQGVEQRLRTADSEVTALHDQKQELAHQLEQVTKEQERLAQENEILRKQQTTEQLVTGKGGELPSLPPK